ncbi:MAG: carboxypeptidase-like regulatory domain-containing protein [Bacteroidota bacterium]|nr:carboxypeptidase-like regulatory domain-containing protein [Candidatus Kapabacteria bacterium]MDW8220299.1 carboxypeptidase-like regulatory domain-containing protein [Bacteroidota bacterium]
MRHVQLSQSRLVCTMLLTLILLCFVYRTLHAQVTLVLNTPSTLPERVSDWERLNAAFSVTVVNTGSTTLSRLRIAATVTQLDNNAVLFRTKNDLTRPFTLAPGIPQTLTAPQILPANSFEYDASVQAAIIRTNTLPEGTYRLCVRVIDERGATLGIEQCRTFTVIIPDPPSLISPANRDSIQRVAPSAPYLPMFQWTQVLARFGQQSRYKLRVVPIFRGQQPRQALEGNPPLFEKVLSTNSYQWLPSDPRFENYPNASGFVWQVQATDPNDPNPTNPRSIGRNDGKSEIFTFAMRTQTDLVNANTLSRASALSSPSRGNGKISSNTPLPMSVIRGKIQWSYRASALNKDPLQDASPLPAEALSSAGEIVSAVVGNRLGSNPSTTTLKAAVAELSYPLPNLTVKVFASRASQHGKLHVNLGNQQISLPNQLVPDILLGTAKTDQNGMFTIEFVNPIFAKQGAYLGDTVITRTKQEKNNKGQYVTVSYKDTISLFATTGEFETLTLKVVAESPYFLIEQKTVSITADSVKKTLDVGTLYALARTFRLKMTVLKRVKKEDKNSSEPAENPIVSIYRPQEFYTEPSHAALSPEKSNSTKSIQSIANTACVLLHSFNAEQLSKPLFLNQQGLHDRYYVRISANKCQPLEIILQVYEASIATDGIADVHLRVVLDAAGGSIVHGNIRRLNLEGLPPSTYLAQAPTDPLNGVKVALVPFVATSDAVQARLYATTDQNGNFSIDSVPKGAYLLQAAGAVLYFAQDFRLASWQKVEIGNKSASTDNPLVEYFGYVNIKDISQAQNISVPSPGLLVVVDGQSEEEHIQGYVLSPLALVCGRVTDDLENLVSSVEISQLSSVKAKAMTDPDGRFALPVAYGTTTLLFKRKGFPPQTKHVHVKAPETFFIPPVHVIKIQPPVDKATSQGIDLLIKIKGMHKINPNPVESKISELFATPVMRSIATGAMSKLVNSPSMLPIGASGKSFTLSATGYSAQSAPIPALSITGPKGAYSQAESNLFGAFTADVFSNGKAAGTAVFGKDAGWEDVTWYNHAAAHYSPLTIEALNTDAVTIHDMGITSINRGVALAVSVQHKTTKAPIAQAIVTFGDKSALTQESMGKPVPAVITGIKPGASAKTTVPVHIEGPASANFIPCIIDVGLQSNTDTTFIQAELSTGGRVTGTVELRDANGNPLQPPQEFWSSVSVREEGFENLSYTTPDSKGSFVLRGVRPQGTTIVAVAPGFIAAKAQVSLKPDETKTITLTLKKSPFTLEKIYGFPVEITSLTSGEKTVTVSGAFTNIPNNSAFSIPKGTRLPFTHVKLVASGNTWIPENNTIRTDVSMLPIQAWQKIPLIMKSSDGGNIQIMSGSNSSSQGLIQGVVTLNYTKFIEQGKGPWEFEALKTMQLTQNPIPFFFSDGAKNPDISAFTLPNQTYPVTIYSISTLFTLKGAKLDATGFHLKGTLALTQSDFADVFKDANGKAVQFTVNDAHIKPNASLGIIDIGTHGSGVSFSKGVFNFHAHTIDFTVEGLKLIGTIDFKLHNGIISASDIKFDNLMMFVSKASGGFGVAAGTFSLNSNAVTLAGLPLSGKGFSFGIVPNSANTFFLRGSASITNVPYVTTLGLTAEIRSNGEALITSEPGFQTSWAGIAEFAVTSIELNPQAAELTAHGSIALNIPGVVSLSGGGLVFSSKGLQKIQPFGGEIDLKIAKLNIAALSFGENLSPPPKLSEPNVGGPYNDAWSSPLWLSDKRTGFEAKGINLTIPGLGLNAKANIGYYKLADGREFSVDILSNPPELLPPIFLGPVTIKPTGGGLTINTQDKDIALRLFSSISIANLDQLVALNPAIMEVKVGASAGVQIAARALLTLYGQKAGNATGFFAPLDKRFRVTAQAQMSSNQFFNIPAVDATGKANITLDLDGKQGYMYAGVGLSAQVNVINLVTAHAHGGVVLGYKAPRSVMTPEQAIVVPSSYDKFSGVAFALDTKFGREEHEASTYDILICDAKVWAYSKASTKFFLLRNEGSGATSFGFDASTGWGGGARCGCVGASIAIGAKIGGGYEGDGRGWYFGGSAFGSAELCAGFCVDLDVKASMTYQQNPKKTEFDIDIEVF